MTNERLLGGFGVDFLQSKTPALGRYLTVKRWIPSLVRGTRYKLGIIQQRSKDSTKRLPLCPPFTAK